MAELCLRIVGECVIEIGERELTPDAPHLFALALYLGVERGRPISRAELCELLFPRAEHPRYAAHCLRQLLYRLRQVGAPLEVSASTIKLTEERSYLGRFVAMTPAARSRSRKHDWLILPSYEPQISEAFTEWLDSFRASLAGEIRQLLLHDLDALQHACDWEAAICTGHLYQEVDASNPRVVAALAEAHLMRGRKSVALQEIDCYLASLGTQGHCSELVRLRARIEKSSSSGRPQAALQGRADALATLHALWQNVVTGQPSLCLVHGSAGIGKTRLASEFVSLVSLQRGRTLSYHCDPIDLQRPLSAFGQFAPQLRTSRGSIGAAPSLKRYLDLLTGEADGEQSLESAVLEATRREIARALVDLIEAVSSEQPLVLFIDDAEFLDRASWEVLSSLCRPERQAAVLVLCCCRTASTATLPQTHGRATVLQLQPLQEVDANALLTELILPHGRDPARMAQCVARAGGNPLFLHALARHWADSQNGSGVPFDIRQLVSSQYLSLDADSRAVLESCLFLGRFATLRRLRRVASLRDARLLAAVRRLEGEGLLTSNAGECRIPHALLAEAVRESIQPTVATLVQERVAKCLARDYDGSRGSAPLAWAAAESWCQAGEPAAAVDLLRRCATISASIGEPRAAAQTLRRIPLASLPLSDQAELLRETAEYAEVGRDYELLQTISTEQLGQAHALLLRDEERAKSFLRVIEARIQQGEDPQQFVAQLRNFLVDQAIEVELRVRAAQRLLSAADVLLDDELATWTASHAAAVYQAMAPSHPDRLTAELMYTAYFGTAEEGCYMALKILERYPEPRLDRGAISARSSAMYALNRLGDHARAIPHYTQDYRFMKEHGVRSAIIDAVNLADIALTAGNIDVARYWVNEIRTSDDSGDPTVPAFYSLSADIALLENRPDEAISFFNQCETFRVVDAPRMRAYMLAGRIRAAIAKDENNGLREHRRELESLYKRGGHLGSQDIVVFALWLAGRRLGDRAGASALLNDYLKARRRELGELDAQLAAAVATDSECTVTKED